jgi:hypothetical protein
MQSTTKRAVPFWYWVIATLALLWNLMGCANFALIVFAQEVALKDMTEDQQVWAKSIPTWIYFVFALALSTGVAGSIGLFLRKGWTIAVFAISLVAVIVQQVYTMLILGGLQVMGPKGAVIPSLVVAFAAALLWFSWFARNRGWLGPVGLTDSPKSSAI